MIKTAHNMIVYSLLFIYQAPIPGTHIMYKTFGTQWFPQAFGA